MDLELLKKFYITVVEGSISAAAKRLNTSQSALSRAMNVFEYRLKTDLLIRDHRGIELTAKGEELFEYAKKMVRENEVFVKNFLEDNNKIAGDLSVVAFPYLGSEWLIPRVKDFLALYPEINLRIHLEPDNVIPFNYDVGVGGFIPNQPHLVQKELFPDRSQFFASKEYLKKYGIPQTPEELDNHRLITYKEQFSFVSYRSINLLFNVGNIPLMPPRKPYFVVDSLAGMINAVLQGYGIAELPTFSAIHYPELQLVLPEIKGKNLPIYFLYQENRKNSKKIQVLYNYLWEKAEKERNEV